MAFANFRWAETSGVDMPANGMEGWVLMKAAADATADAIANGDLQLELPDDFDPEALEAELVKHEALTKAAGELIASLVALRNADDFAQLPEEVQKAADTLTGFFGSGFGADAQRDADAGAGSNPLGELMLGLLRGLVRRNKSKTPQDIEPAALAKAITEAAPAFVKSVVEIRASGLTADETRDRVSAAVVQFENAIRAVAGGSTENSAEE